MDTQEKEQQKPETKFQKWNMLGLAFELGFIIALPVLVFGLIGKWLDARFGTEPLLVLIGVLTAIVSTTLWIYRKFAGYFNKK